MENEKECDSMEQQKLLRNIPKVDELLTLAGELLAELPGLDLSVLE